nr:hypothetical protein [Tanacetum cinerariifolium]
FSGWRIHGPRRTADKTKDADDHHGATDQAGAMSRGVDGRLHRRAAELAARLDAGGRALFLKVPMHAALEGVSRDQPMALQVVRLGWHPGCRQIRRAGADH